VSGDDVARAGAGPDPDDLPQDLDHLDDVDLPASVVLEPGEGGLVRVNVSGPAGRAEIYLNGAHVARWRPAGSGDVLFLSTRSRFASGAPIRGGVPICFPWFGPHATDSSAAPHGFARVLPWELVGAHEAGDDVVVELRLEDSPETRTSAWPHPFRATYRVTVGAALRLDLEVTNTGKDPVTFEEALHTYLEIADARQVVVSGLEGTSYLDKVSGGRRVPGEPGPIRLTGETDRVYLDTQAATTVEDPAGARRIVVGKESSDSTVVWNPWVEKAAAMADMADDEWTGMLCVETCNVGARAVTLAPGASHTMTAILEVQLAG
jgi:glucose-6-phosphate 1-epimerase